MTTFARLTETMASLRPTSQDRVTLARIALQTASEAAKAGDARAAFIFIRDALLHLETEHD